ncbi:MAG: hypothetical protein PWQ82_1154 [Thermosediminibacterales bacterium]|nr:hypothetical protein [Thermosediminibacterales bacterium]MDK2836145.1 hypothetical protein [Thermosediminibacterales bacterium]
MRKTLGVISFVGLLFLLVALLAGCNDISPEDVVKEIKQRFEKIEDLQVTVKTSYFNGDETYIYETKQYFKKPNFYRTEVVSPDILKGKITIFDGKRFVLLNKKIGDGFELNNIDDIKQDLTIISKVFKEIEENKEAIHFNKETKDDRKYYVIEYVIDKANNFSYKKKIWFNAKTFMPEFVNVLRKGGKPYMNIEYINIKINQGLDDSLFNVNYSRL